MNQNQNPRQNPDAQNRGSRPRQNQPPTAGRGQMSGGQRPPLTSEEQAAARRAAEQRAKQRRERLKKQQAAAEKAQKKQKKEAEKQRKKQLEARRRAQEKMRRHDERFELTEEERAIRAQMKREERQYKSRQRARRAKVFAGRFVLFVLMFASMLGISAGLFYLNLVKYEVAARRDFSYKVGEASAVSVKYDSMMRGGHLYVNLTPIIDLCEMAVTGDTAELRYISRDAEEHVKFIVGSTQVFINGVEERISAAPYLDGEDLYVPYDFFSSYVEGISVLYDQEKQAVTVAQVPTEDDASVMQSLRFTIRSDAPLVGLDEYNEFGQTSPVEFVADLSLYEDFMNPKNRDEYLLLVNAEYPLPQSYVPQTVEIVDIRHDGRPWQYLDFVAERAAHAMIMELAANGFPDVNILLGYRSYSKQRYFYDNTVADYMKTMTEEQAKVAASSVAQVAGANPQQTGYSMIMHNQEDDYSTAFSRDPAYAWLLENCWKFGFIIRYPADKTAETGMAFQPYFFTYVGRYHAMRIMEQGLSMEEYIVGLEERNYFGKPYAEFRQDLIDKVNK
ncbi:MAG: D-alanyl-D-alanine carboxypeptidase family protein [Clostridia bacterium]|nr:D-alanyl-D-alanine carboxypeptidase family protein [Clostridia bacterium]